jgi:outer membrane lipoprotein SlyB
VETDRSVENIRRTILKKLLTLLLITALAITGCGNNNTDVSAIEETYTAVEVETLKPMELHIENLR